MTTPTKEDRLPDARALELVEKVRGKIVKIDDAEYDYQAPDKHQAALLITQYADKRVAEARKRAAEWHLHNNDACRDDSEVIALYARIAQLEAQLKGAKGENNI